MWLIAGSLIGRVREFYGRLRTCFGGDFYEKIVVIFCPLLKTKPGICPLFSGLWSNLMNFEVGESREKSVFAHFFWPFAHF